jgi:hypothetical protein
LGRKIILFSYGFIFFCLVYNIKRMRPLPSQGDNKDTTANRIVICLIVCRGIFFGYI